MTSIPRAVELGGRGAGRASRPPGGRGSGRARARRGAGGRRSRRARGRRRAPSGAPRPRDRPSGRARSPAAARSPASRSERATEPRSRPSSGAVIHAGTIAGSPLPAVDRARNGVVAKRLRSGGRRMTFGAVVHPGDVDPERDRRRRAVDVPGPVHVERDEIAAARRQPHVGRRPSSGPAAATPASAQSALVVTRRRSRSSARSRRGGSRRESSSNPLARSIGDSVVNAASKSAAPPGLFAQLPAPAFSHASSPMTIASSRPPSRPSTPTIVNSAAGSIALDEGRRHRHACRPAVVAGTSPVLTTDDPVRVEVGERVGGVDEVRAARRTARAAGVGTSSGLVGDRGQWLRRPAQPARLRGRRSRPSGRSRRGRGRRPRRRRWR